MESNFQVWISPNKMREVFEDVEHNIRYYEFLGIRKKGDFDFENCSDSERKELNEVPCLYKVRLRHADYLSHLHGTYSSWRGVMQAIQIRKNEIAKLTNH